MFRKAAEQLPDYFGAEQFWPKYALLTHAIELALKAFAQYSVEDAGQRTKTARLTWMVQLGTSIWTSTRTKYCAQSPSFE